MKKILVTCSMAVLLLVAPRLFSQAAVGTILGGVFDSAGGAVADAKVTIIDVARGTTRVLTTDQAGEYTAPELLSGTYTVRAEAKGFKAEERTNVLLEVAQNVRVDLALSPGEQTQTVTVTDVAPAIDTTDASLGGTVSNQSVMALPLFTRNFLQLLELRPGVVDQPGQDGSATSTNGRRTGSDVILVEGITQFDLETANTLINGDNKGGSAEGGNRLPLDAVQEFSTQQNPPAEYGWRDGSAVNLAVKSGTNSIHGTAYAFGRDAAATDAKDFFSGTTGNLVTEQFGATAGGPVLKDKLFWFAAFEGVRQSSVSTTSVNDPVDVSLATTATPAGNPTTSMVDACNAVKTAGGTINPLSAQIAGLNVTTCAVSPMTSSFENLFPYNSTSSILVFPGGITSTPLNNGLAKVDFVPNEHHHMTGFVYISKDTQVDQGAVIPTLWGIDGVGDTREYAGSWTYTPNSTWVNDLRGGADPTLGNSVRFDVNSLPGNPYPAGYGINTGVTNPEYGGAPCITIAGGFFGGSGRTPGGLGDCANAGARGPQYQADFSDKVSHLYGNHAFKFGFEQVFANTNGSQLNTVPGTINFGSTAVPGGLTNPTSLTNFLTGTPNGASAGSIEIGFLDTHYREQWHAAFIEDTWRVTHRVTLTPGLRWEYIGSPHSTVNGLGTFDPNQPGGVVQVGPGLPNPTLLHAQKTDFNPRLGVAWDIWGNGKTVLRAGGGLLSSFPPLSAIAAQAPYGATFCTGPASYAAGTSASTELATSCDLPAAGTVGANPGVTIVNRFGTAINSSFPNPLSFVQNQLNWSTAGPIFPIVSSLGIACTTANPCTTAATDPNFKQPRSVQWNLDIQRAITNRLTLDVAYVGNHGYDETHSIDLNQPPVGTGWDTSAVTACLASASKCVPDQTAIVAARTYSAEFPYLNFIDRTTSGFNSNYDALQITLDSRNYHGLSFLTAYTYGHALDEYSSDALSTPELANPANPAYQYGNSSNDIRQRFRFSPTYAIPGIKSPGQMLEGWSLSGILALQSGFAWGVDDTKNDWGGTGVVSVQQTWNYTGPLSAFDNTGVTSIPCYGKLTNCTAFASAPLSIQGVCMAAAQAPYSNATQKALALQALANEACYIQKGGVLTPPAYGTLGDLARDSFYGPHYYDVDMTLGKTWHVKERYSAQFRVECYNLFNHPSFALPSGDPTTGASQFGYSIASAGHPRQFQFALKLGF